MRPRRQPVILLLAFAAFALLGPLAATASGAQTATTEGPCGASPCQTVGSNPQGPCGPNPCGPAAGQPAQGPCGPNPCGETKVIPGNQGGAPAPAQPAPGAAPGATPSAAPGAKATSPANTAGGKAGNESVKERQAQEHSGAPVPLAERAAANLDERKDHSAGKLVLAFAICLVLTAVVLGLAGQGSGRRP